MVVGANDRPLDPLRGCPIQSLDELEKVKCEEY